MGKIAKAAHYYIPCNSLGLMYEEHQGVLEDDARASLTKGCNLSSQSGCDNLKEMK